MNVWEILRCINSIDHCIGTLRLTGQKRVHSHTTTTPATPHATPSPNSAPHISTNSMPTPTHECSASPHVVLSRAGFRAVQKPRPFLDKHPEDTAPSTADYVVSRKSYHRRAGSVRNSVAAYADRRHIRQAAGCPSYLARIATAD